MFTSGWPFLVLVTVVLAIYGGAIGAATGLVLGILSKNRLMGALWDLAFGALGYVGAYAFFIFLPWPTNTVKTVSPSGFTEISTMNRYQGDIFPFAMAAAMLIPIIHQVWFATRRTDEGRRTKN